MRVDKKARGAVLRFVVLDGIGRPGRLDGPDENLLADVFGKVSIVTQSAGAQRPQPRPARLARARGLRRATHDDLVAACAEAGAELGLEVEVRQTDDEAELVGWLHEAADAGDPRRAQPGGVHALLLRRARRLRRARPPRWSRST